MIKKILICDDDEGILDVASLIIIEMGFDVVKVKNAKDVMSFIETYSPALILMDLWMPEISGDEMTKILKANPETKNIPIILLSAHRDIQKKAEISKADAFINKPFEIDEFESVIKRFI